MVQLVRLIVACGVLLGAWPDRPVCAAEPNSTGIIRLLVDPEMITLDGSGSLVTPLVSGETAFGQRIDLTSQAKLEVLAPASFLVDSQQRLRGLNDGSGMLRVSAAGQQAEVAVQVRGMRLARQFHFENDILPILSKFSCNMSGCHGKAEGQNGFKLSVFGYDPGADHVALTQESRGRRVNPLNPAASLLLQKASGGMPHGGGVRIAKTSEEYRTLLEWLASGMQYGSQEAPHVVGITVTPHERTLPLKGSQKLRVVARYSNGREADVTHHARFQSNNEAVAKVDEFGFVTAGEVPGDVAIMAGYLGPSMSFAL